jgi:hypothetical protein
VVSFALASIVALHTLNAVGHGSTSLAAEFVDTTVGQDVTRAAPANSSINTSEFSWVIPDANVNSAQAAKPKLASSPPFDSGANKVPSGAPQHSNLLDAYVARPPWKVAGVDYRVGVTEGTVLKPISEISMDGVTLDTGNKLIRVTGQNLIIDGYDFSGWSFYIEGQNITLQNCYSNMGRGYWISGRADGEGSTSSNITIRSCELDGAGLEFEDNWSFINLRGAGISTIEYCWLHNAPAHFLEMGGTSKLLYRYNLVEEGGIDPTGKGPTNHVNFSQMLGGQNANSEITFNTMIQHRQPAGGQMIQITGANGLVANNTLIAYPGHGGPSISHMIDPGHAGEFFQGTIRDNYIDRRGAINAFYPSANRPNVTAIDNINMVTGRIIQANNAERPLSANHPRMAK